MKTLRIIGIALILLSGLGFLTIADDLRHVGELLFVGSVGVAGVILTIVAQWQIRRRKRLG